MRNIKSTQGQWLGDVAVKHAGGIDALFELAVLNDVSPTENLTPGTQLTPVTIENKRIVSYYERNNINPASSDTGTSRVRRRGIGNMTVGIDFTVG